MAERCIYADDFLDLFYVASAGQDKMFIKVVEQVIKDTPTAVKNCEQCIHFGKSAIQQYCRNYYTDKFQSNNKDRG